MDQPDQDTVLTDMDALLGGATPPTVVAGRYELHRVVGVGGAAVVHEATDTLLERRVAVKLLREGVGDPTDRDRFVSEARLLGSLSHPGLVRVLDAGTDGERPFLVLELMSGRTLADALAAGLSAERIATIGAEVATALAHVHAAGIVHRDVKPGNVLLSEDGSARLADFGIARLVDDTRHHTRTGTLVGTVAYLAPEQVAGEPATTAVDIYAWGLVLLEAVTGVRQFGGSSIESALARLSRQPEVPRSLPADWRRLLLAMTARDPAARPTAAVAAGRLRALSGATATTAPTVLSTRTRSLSPRSVLAGVGAAFALLLGVAAAPALTGLHDPAAGEAARRASATVGAPTTGAAPADAAPDAAPAVAPLTTPGATPAPTGTRHGHHAQPRRHHQAKHQHKAKHGHGHAKGKGKGHKKGRH